LGGFVRLFGEEYTSQDLKSTKQPTDAFYTKSIKSRFVVIIAGVVGNFLLAIFLFTIVYSVMGIPRESLKTFQVIPRTEDVEGQGPLGIELGELKSGQPVITRIAAGSPAERVGIKSDSQILAINNLNMASVEQVIELTKQKRGQEISIKVAQTEMVKYPFYKMIPLGIIQGFKEAIAWGTLIIDFLGKMIRDLIFQGIVPKDVSGPIGVFQATGIVAKTGFINILQFAGILSVNLAIVNVLPLPALDGGHLIFIAYEAITRKKPKPEFFHWVNTIGFFLLIGLVILISVGDVRRLIGNTWPF
jgi:regulator of sigma E protease